MNDIIKTGEEVYRYGFNGKENDNEVKGAGDQIAFENRIYDPRLGRWFSLDPMQKKYPNESHYGFVSNNPVLYADKDGKDKIVNVTIIQKDGTLLQYNTVDKTYFDYYTHARYDGMGYYYYKQDVVQNIVIDNRTGGKVIGTNEYSNKQEIDFSEYVTKKYYKPLSEIFKGGDQSSKSVIGIGLYGDGNSSADKGKAKPAPGSELIDASGFFAALEGFKDMPSEDFSAEVQDFFKGEKGKKLLERFVNSTKAAKYTNAAKESFDKTLTEDNSNTLNNTESQKKPVVIPVVNKVYNHYGNKENKDGKNGVGVTTSESSDYSNPAGDTIFRTRTEYRKN